MTDPVHAVHTMCLTHGRYTHDVPAAGCCATAADHDHYDVAVNAHGDVVFRYWPVGTTWREPDGTMLRLTRYQTPLDTDATPVPVFDVWTPLGGATRSDTLPSADAVIVVHATTIDHRPAPGSVYARPNGEIWRLRSYATDWDNEPYDNVIATWSVQLPTGANTNGRSLPDDAHLIWTP